MVCIYLPAFYYHLNLDIKERVCWRAGFSAVPAVFLVNYELLDLLNVPHECSEIRKSCDTVYLLHDLVPTSSHYGPV